ncbi:exonuclease [Rhizobium anhuiense]|uniref:3'-5' exonuclease n=1 Tax=Rhizobium TaxID=379 RepID=UPI000BE91E3D|nr:MULTISPECIES: 3'-5' exoribonuclease [Rhizobium]PDS56379.1 exonuclease [Rhizobium anhuiense]TBA89025.1 exonuclease [Rhizobium ruizarguesonis]
MAQITLEQSFATNAHASLSCAVPNTKSESKVDVYFSADIETDGPIPGPYSILSFALVYAGSYDGKTFRRPRDYDNHFYRELKPISNEYEPEALAVNGLDRDSLIQTGMLPAQAMREANEWVRKIAGDGNPVFVAYPLSFDWTWLYWYFVRFSKRGSPFGHSRCFDIKTAVSVKSGFPIAGSGRSKLPNELLPKRAHTHHALDDAIEQAEIFANVFEWEV